MDDDRHGSVTFEGSKENIGNQVRKYRSEDHAECNSNPTSCSSGEGMSARKQNFDEVSMRKLLTAAFIFMIGQRCSAERGSYPEKEMQRSRCRQATIATFFQRG